MWFLPLLLLGAIAIAAASRSNRDVAPRQLAAGPALMTAPAGPSESRPGPISVLGEIVKIGQVPPPKVILCAIAEAEALGRPDLASDIVRAFVAPVVHRHRQSSSRGQRPYERGTCKISCAPRAQADAAPGAPEQTQQPQAAPALTTRPATEDEILAMIHTDPQAFVKMASSGRHPMVEVPIAPPASPTAEAPAAPEAIINDQVAAQLSQMPGFVGAGILNIDPSTRDEVFEVRWLRGYPLPPLPEQLFGRAVQVTVVDALPVAQQVAPPVVQPGSPIARVPDDAWREFVTRLSREAPEFTSSRHVGQYRQRRERLVELGIDPRAIHGSATAQRSALDTDLADAHAHAAAGGLLEHLGRAIAVPGHEGSATITLSGVLGVILCAGLDGAVGWLEKPNDRKRYPHTTQAFLRSNGVF